MTAARIRLGALVVACVAIVAGLSGIDDRTLDVTPAAANVEVATPAAERHTPNTLAYVGCGATRQSEEHTLDHAHVIGMGPGYLHVSCASHAEDMYCNWTMYVIDGFGAYGPINPTCQVVG